MSIILQDVCRTAGIKDIAPSKEASSTAKILNDLENVVYLLTDDLELIKKKFAELGGKLNPKTQKLYMDKYPDRRHDLSIINKFILALELTHTDRKFIKSDRPIILEILNLCKKFQQKISGLPDNLKDIYIEKEKEAAKRTNLATEIIRESLKTVKDVLGGRLPKAYQLKLGYDNPQVWEKLTRAKILDLFPALCRQIEVKSKPKAVIAAPLRSTLPPAPSRFEYNFRLGGNYSAAVNSPDDTELSPAIGGTLFGGGTLSLRLKKNLGLQLDVDMSGGYNPAREEKVFNDNLFLLSLVNKKAEKIKWFVQAGYKSYANIRPSFLLPDQDSAVLTGGISYHPKQWLSINLVPGIKIGSTNYSLPEEKPGLFVNFQTAAGAVFKLKDYYLSPNIIAGLSAHGDLRQGFVGGGLNGSAQFGRFDIFTNFYGISYPGRQANFGLSAGSGVKIGKHFRIFAFFGPFESVESVNTLGGGLGFEAGSQLPKLTQTFEPFASNPGSNLWQY